MTVEFWGLFDPQRQDFVSRSTGHSDQYIDTCLHHTSRATVESWLDDGSKFYGRYVEVRLIGPEHASRMSGCICKEHRRLESKP